MGCPSTARACWYSVEPHEKNPTMLQASSLCGSVHCWNTTLLYTKEVLICYYFTKKKVRFPIANSSN